MSGRSSPVNGGYEAARLTVRKDLFPDVPPPGETDTSEDEMISSIKLETDFEKSIDEIAIKKQQVMANGTMSSPPRSRRKRRKQRSRKNSERSNANGYLPTEKKRKKRSRHRTHTNSTEVLKVHSGKNLSLVSSSECQAEDEEEAEEEVAPSSSDDEVLKFSVKLPLINMPRQSGKPYSHELSQLSTKKRKKEKEKKSKEKHSHAIIPCSGKPRSMLDICSHSKKKSKKSEVSVATYRSQIVDTNIMKIKIRRTSVHETLAPAPVPMSIADLGQRKSKKKRAASPVPSESSGEEYDPSRGETAALGRVCKLWHSISCSPELWKHIDLAQYTTEKCKTDYKLVWLLENRLSKCQSLNI
ncbi:F-box/LRR-repeat protein 6, partial [Operophtera brumata]